MTPRRWTWFALVLAMSLAWAGASLRPLEPYHNVGFLTERSSFLRKVEWASVADVVFCGDSRTGHCIVPQIIERQLPGRRVRNFTFNGVSLSEPYLSAARRCLDRRTSGVLVVGVTPRAFLEQSRKFNGYQDCASLSTAERMSEIYLSPIYHHFRPWRPRSWLDWALGRKKVLEAERRFHWNGWVEVTPSLPDPEYELAWSRNFYKEAAQDEKGIQEFERALSDWVKSGITVIVFRPPTSHRMMELERELCPFDEKDLIDRVRSSGAVWLPPPRNREFRTWDASHLDAAEAREFSSWMSDELARLLNTTGGRDASPVPEKDQLRAGE